MAKERGYRYLALDVQGRLVEGFERGSNRRELSLSLSRGERILIRCCLVRKCPLRGEWFFGLLRHLLAQGLSLRDALELVTETAPPRARWSLRMILQDLQRGHALAEALRHQGLFPSFVLCSLQQAEVSGTLTETCSSLQTFFQTQHKLRKQRRQAWVYPGLLLGTLGVVLTSLLVTLVPQLREVLADGSLLVAPSRSRDFLFWLSTLVQNQPWVYAALVGGLGGLCGLFLRLRFFAARSRGRTSPEDLLWMTTVALLLQSRVPLLQALSITEQAHWSSSFQLGLGRLAQSLRQGESFGDSLRHLPSVPKSFVMFAKLGEKSGSLGNFLAKGAALSTKDYTEKVEKRLALLTPTVLCFAGCGLIWMVLTLFQPFTRLMGQWE